MITVASKLLREVHKLISDVSLAEWNAIATIDDAVEEEIKPTESPLDSPTTRLQCPVCQSTTQCPACPSCQTITDGPVSGVAQTTVPQTTTVADAVTVAPLACSSNPCVNGNCLGLNGGAYYCQCNTGYIGATCNTGMAQSC